MKKGGYPTHSAAAIEAVASTGGQLMPPMMGIAAFVMAELLQIGYAEVVIAALIPAILYYAAPVSSRSTCKRRATASFPSRNR